MRNRGFTAQVKQAASIRGDAAAAVELDMKVPHSGKFARATKYFSKYFPAALYLLIYTLLTVLSTSFITSLSG
jgi:hypothetical protein